jgi:hypothetical protein
MDKNLNSGNLVANQSNLVKSPTGTHNIYKNIVVFHCTAHRGIVIIPFLYKLIYPPQKTYSAIYDTVLLSHHPHTNPPINTPAAALIKILSEFPKRLRVHPLPRLDLRVQPRIEIPLQAIHPHHTVTAAIKLQKCFVHNCLSSWIQLTSDFL